MQLYHWEANGASARVLIALAEKSLAYEGHYVDLLARAQHRPEYTALNATGEVPVLVRNGQAHNEASYICEYLEEAFPEAPALMPADPHGRWLVRGWQKYVDDYLAGAISDLAWHARRKDVHPSVLAAGVQSAPTHERRQVWQEHQAPFPADRLAKGREYVGQAVVKMDAALAGHDWLAGDAFSLADIAVYAYAAYLPRIAPDLLSRPVRTWLTRVAARPSIAEAVQAGRTDDPYAVAAPGPEHTRWG